MYYLVATKNGDTFMCNRVVFGAVGDSENVLAYLVVDNKPTLTQLSEGASEMDIITIPKGEIVYVKEVGTTQDTLDFVVELILGQPETVEIEDNSYLRGYN